MEGVGGVQHGARLVRRERPQPQPVGEIGVQPLQLAALDALAGQQQMHPDRPADPADGEEQIDEIGLCGEQFAEFVDHDEQMRQRRQFGPLRTGGAVGGDIGQIACVLEDLLTAPDLPGEAGVDAFDQSRAVLQVRDHARDMRQRGERCEGGTALVVDQHHRQVLGRMTGHQGQHQRAQQFALPGSGGPDTQPVRPHAQLGGLLQIEQHRLAVVVQPDRHPQERLLPARLPEPRHIELARVRRAQQFGEVHRAGQRGTRGGRLRGEPQRGEHPGQAVCAGGGDVVQGAVYGGRSRVRFLPQVLHRNAPGPPARDRHPQRHLPRLLHLLGHQMQHGDAHVLERHRLIGARQFARRLSIPVADDQQPLGQPEGVLARQPAAHLRRVRRALAQLGGERGAQLRGAGGDTTGADRTVPLRRIQHMRQPLRPLPVGQPLLGAGDGDRHVIGRMRDRRLHDERPHGPQHRVPFADDGDIARPVERNRQRHLRRRTEPLLQPGRLIEHERIGRCEHTAALPLHREHADGHRAGPDAHLQEVRVRTPPFPPPRRIAHQVVQRLRRRGEHPGRRPPGAVLGAQFLA